MPQRRRSLAAVPSASCRLPAVVPGEPVPFYRCASAKARTFVAPRTPFGQPDLQGYWAHGRQNYDLEDHPETFDARQETTAIVDPADGKIPYLPWAAAKVKDIRAHIADPPSLEYLNPNSRCYLRSAVPQIYPPFPLQIVQTPTHVVILQEQNHAYQLIPVDGRPHLGAGIRLWMGDSRGRWEGSTLVVETTNLYARLANRNWLDQAGNFYTDKARLRTALHSRRRRHPDLRGDDHRPRRVYTAVEARHAIETSEGNGLPAHGVRLPRRKPRAGPVTPAGALMTARVFVAAFWRRGRLQPGPCMRRRDRHYNSISANPYLSMREYSWARVKPRSLAARVLL